VVVSRSRTGLLTTAWAIRLAIAGLFIFAAVLKIWDPREFAINVRAYRFLPWWAVHPVALVVPWLEVVMAGALLLRRWWSAGAALTFGVTLAYCGVHVSAIVRHLDVTCSCFGKLRALTPPQMLALNIAILLCIIALVIIQRRLRPPERRRAEASEPGPPTLAAEPASRS
jgi:putative oxidoreductase